MQLLDHQREASATINPSLLIKVLPEFPKLVVQHTVMAQLTVILIYVHGFIMIYNRLAIEARFPLVTVNGHNCKLCFGVWMSMVDILN